MIFILSCNYNEAPVLELSPQTDLLKLVKTPCLFAIFLFIINSTELCRQLCNHCMLKVA